MKFKNIILKNKYIDIKLQNIDFSHKGIYLITGKNGTGKSTMLKEIVFGHNNATFYTKEQQDAYTNHRASIISYVPQEIPVPDTNVRLYIKKDNPNVTDKDIALYLNKFDMSDVNLNQKIKVLSGGEHTKLCIISALLKQTPYLILDEPTNNLDDGSTTILISEIEEYAKENTVLIVSHDPRVVFEKAYHVNLDSEGISQDGVSNNENKNLPSLIPHISGTKLSLRLSKAKQNILGTLIFICVLCAALLFNLHEFTDGYNYETPPEAGAILAYMAENTYPNLNEYYVNGSGISIDEAKYNTLIRYETISEIAKIEGVEKIYIERQSWYDSLNDSDDSSEPILSIPDVIKDNYLSQTGLEYYLSVEEGRTPTDGENEIALSTYVLSNQFGIEYDENTIGTTIELNNENYTIVGITTFDLCWISYDEEDNLLYYCYDTDTFETFMNEEINYKVDSEYMYEYEPEFICIETSVDEEKNILNTLMTNYPANNYDSYIYAKTWSLTYNLEFLRYISLIDIIFVAIAIILLIQINKTLFINDFIYLEDYRNYYILDDNIRKTYMLSRIIIKLIILATICIIGSIFSTNYMINILMITVMGMVIIVSDLIHSYMTLKKLKKNQ